MATRRPKVPSAQFSAGANKSAAEPGTTPDPTRDAHAALPGARRRATGGDGAARAARKPVTGPHRRTGAAPGGPRRETAEGVIHTAEANTPVPARSFNGRLLVLGLAMAAVTVALAPNIHTYLDQRAEISTLQQDIAAQTAQQALAQSELARWDDPAYVQQQARDRVSMLMPGETGYWVYGAAPAATAGATPPAAAGESAKKATTVTTEPWVDSLWQAVEKSSAVKPDASKPAPTAGTKPAAK